MACVTMLIHARALFSFDARKHQLRDGRHWSDVQVLGARAHFRLAASGEMSRLILTDVRSSDQGLYRCRVDFKSSPTRNANVNLTIAGKSFWCGPCHLFIRSHFSLLTEYPL